MASYFTLTLDTTAPSGVSVSINGDDIYTTVRNVTLTIGISDEATSGYQMKVWGIQGVDSESAASWESFAESKSVQLTDGDGLKTVYVKVRDDVGNESTTASDTITLNTVVPTVTITGPDKTRISKVSTFDKSVFNFTADVIFDEYKVCVVPSSNSTHDAGTVIGTAGGSLNTSGSAGDYPASTNIQVTITGADLETASSGDGAKVIKVFVKSQAGLWSAA